ncbi:hypothetical protein FBULB1_1425 [Fusarium bulbicola]|nr:hypothetical protein FBULB1_1425 [Fusarium bulbicola]
MPSEVLLMIGSYLTYREFSAYSAVSKLFRTLLDAKHFTAVRLSGTLEGLAKKLRLFQEFLERKENVFKQTRHATFQITDINESENPGHFCDASLTSDLIGSCIERMTGLHDVTFDLDLKGKSSSFKEHFRSKHKWSKPCNLILHGANGTASETIIRNFKPGILETVQLPMEISTTYYKPLKTCRQSLKALHTFIPLQCRSNIARQNEKVDVLTEALKSTKRLRRFAFGLWSCRVPELIIRRRWPMESKSCADLDAWYVNLLRSILAKVPQLEELCILDQHRFYRGTWSGDCIEIRALSFDDPGERDRFPNLLYGMAIDFAYIIVTRHKANDGTSKE